MSLGIGRTLLHYRRMAAAVVAGTAVGTAVLVGALLVGDSVEVSLRRLTLDRLGSIDGALVGETFFVSDLAERLGSTEGQGGSERIEAAVVLQGSAAHASTGSRASRVQFLGVEPGFAGFFGSGSSGVLEAMAGDGVFPPAAINAALARELDAQVGDALLLSYERRSAVPRDSLLGRDRPEDVLGTLRVNIAAVLPDRTQSPADAGDAPVAATGPGNFSFAPGQGVPLTVYLPRERLADALDQPGRANAVFASASATTLDERLRRVLTADDLGLALTPVEPRDPGEPGGPGDGWSALTSRRLVLDPQVIEAAEAVSAERGVPTQPILVYLANEISGPDGTIPYSTVAALPTPVVAPFGSLPLEGSGEAAPELVDDDVLLNAWAARELGAAVGDEVEMEYYEVGARDELVTATRRFRVAAVVAMEGLGADPTLTPDVPGVSDADDMSDWDPPFPVDLSTIRSEDEEYWDEYRGAPKAFVSLKTGQELWTSRFGDLTALRLGTDDAEGLAEAVTAALPEGAFGMRFQSLRGDGLAASGGATDWGGLFLGFSLFLIVSACLLVGLLFRLLIERRAAELGLLLAVGYPQKSVRLRLAAEGLLLGVVGVVLGALLGIGYGEILVDRLTSWWAPLLGGGGAETSFLELSVAPHLLAVGALGMLALVLLVVVLSVRRLGRAPARSLLSGSFLTAEDGPTGGSPKARWIALGAGALSALLLVASLLLEDARPALFFGLGAALVVLGLALFALWSRRPTGSLAPGGAVLPAMAARNGARHLGRSLLAVTLVASACFVLVAVTANRSDPSRADHDRTSGTGGFALVAESRVPIRQDLTDPDELDELGVEAETLAALESAEVYPLRLLPGEDASCLNLYKPKTPRVLGVPSALVERGGFAPEDENPWELLARELAPAIDAETREEIPVVPTLGDEASVRWILGLAPGDDLEMVDDRGRRVNLRIVGMLHKSLFQSEVLISEEAFLRHFPDHGGYGYFLIDTPEGAEAATETAQVLERDLGPWGFDAESAPEKLAAYQAIENLYLTTFQALGGLGLLLGTLGLGVILLRNVLERRGELATLRAFGFERRFLSRMVLAENAFLLVVGLLIGTGAGLAAVAPHLAGSAADVPWGSLALTLGLILVVGMAASLAAVASAARVPLLPVLKGDRG